MAYATLGWDNDTYSGSSSPSTGVYVVDSSSSGLNYDINMHGTGENQTGFEFYVEYANDFTLIENSLGNWLYLDDDGSDFPTISLNINDDYVFPYLHENVYRFNRFLLILN